MSRADGAARWSTSAVVVGVALVAAVVSYRHALEVIRANGETGAVAYLVPLTVDGLIYASSMVLFVAARRGLPVPPLARVLLGLGIVATLAANIAHGLDHGPVGAVVAGWPAVALVGSYELLMWIVRSARPVPERATCGLPADHPQATEEPRAAAGGGAPVPAAPAAAVPAVSARASVTAAVPAPVSAPVSEGVPEPAPEAVDGDPLAVEAAVMFAADIAAGEAPGIRRIREALSIGQPRAQRVRDHLAALAASE